MNERAGLIRLLWILAVVTLATLASAGSGQAVDQYRAYWVDTFHDGIKSQAQVDTMLNDIIASNCNMVYAQVRRRADSYFPSPLEGGCVEDTDYDENFDALAYLIKKCHSATPRIEVHAYMVTLPVWQDGTPLPDPKARPEHPYNLYPEFLTRTQNNTNSILFLDPGNPACEKYLADVYLDVANRYDIDGFHYDYIRYTGIAYGYNQVSQDRFKERTGYVPTDDYDEVWTQWRRDQITAMTRQIYGRARAVEAARKSWGFRPKVSVSGSLITWGGGPSDLSDDEWHMTSAYSSVLQDWRAWMREGILDMAVPMTYYNYSQSNRPAWYGNWIEFEKNSRYNRHMIIGPGTYMNTVPNCYTEIDLALQPSQTGNYADGLSFFSYAYPSGPEPAPPAPQRFRNMLTQAVNADNHNNPPFPTPVGIPAQPWKDSPTTGHIMGVVTKMVGDKSVPYDGAQLTVTVGTDVLRTATTDGNGYYLFVDLPADVAGNHYQLNAAQPDGATWEQSRIVQVTRGNMTTENFNLTPPGVQDTTPPAITDAHVATRTMADLSQRHLNTDSSVVIAWNTDEPADSQVEYGLTEAYGSTTPLDPMLSGSRLGYLNAALGHIVTVRNLLPNTLYHYRVVSRDSSGNASVSADNTFQTLETDVTPPAIFDLAISDINLHGATITWTTNEPATAQVQYGTGVTYGTATTNQLTLQTTHQVVLTDLVSYTTYHLRAISADVHGNAAYSYDISFFTGEQHTTAPAITNVRADTGSSSTIENISWTTDVPSTSQVEYGPTIVYGSSTAVNSTKLTAHVVALSGLKSGALYHYRVKSVDAYGNPATSPDYTFTTNENAPPVFAGIKSVTDIGSNTLLLSWDAAADDTPPVRYYVYQSTTQGRQDFSSPVLITTETSCTISDLTFGQPYYFVVRAQDSDLPTHNMESNKVERSATPCSLIVESDPAGHNPDSYATVSGMSTVSANKSGVLGCTVGTQARVGAPLYTPGGTINRAKITPTIPLTGLYRISHTWASGGPNCKHARYATTFDGGTTDLLYLDQIGAGSTANPDTWLGEALADAIPMTAGTSVFVIADDSENQGAVTDLNGGKFFVDAMRFRYVGPALPAPGNVRIAAGPAAINLAWDAVPGATSYNVYRSNVSGSFSYTPLANVTLFNSYSDATAVPGTPYYYLVRAADSLDRPGFACDEKAATIQQTVFATTGGFVKFGRWNLVSIPGDPLNADPVSVFNGVDVPNASFQFWKNATSDGYQLYGDTFGWTGPVNRGTPYWLIETGTGVDKDLSYVGTPPVGDFVFTIPAHAGAPYWIAIGTPFSTPVQATSIQFRNVAKRGDAWLSWEDAYSNTNSTLRLVDSNCQGWDATGPRFASVTPPAFAGEKSQFEPWWGYWLLVYDPGQLQIRFPKP